MKVIGDTSIIKNNIKKEENSIILPDFSQPLVWTDLQSVLTRRTVPDSPPLEYPPCAREPTG